MAREEESHGGAYEKLVVELVGALVTVVAHFGNATADGAPTPQGTSVLIMAFGFGLSLM